MSEAGDDERLAALRHLAYRRDGGLTAAQADELRELEREVRLAHHQALPVEREGSGESSTEPVDDPVYGDGHHARYPAADDEGEVSKDETRDTTDDEVTPQPEADHGSRWFRRWLIPGAAAAAALALGGGIGWFLAARAADADPAMTSEQTETWTDLEAGGDFDDGSIRLIGSKYDASLWVATQDDGTYTCVILTHREGQARQCRDHDIESYGVGLTAQLDVTVEGTYTYLWGTLATDVTGREVGVINRQQMSEDQMRYDWRSSYSEEELVEAEQLVDAGHQGEMLTILGYDGDRPVWFAQDETSCVIVFTEGGMQQQCIDGYLEPEETIELIVGETVYQARMTETRGVVLTIVRLPSSAG